MSETLFIQHFGNESSRTLEYYLKEMSGYQAIRKAIHLSPELIIQEVKKSALRGRGGAGFPTGTKWSFVPKDPKLQKILICNADESEPGTFKDRDLMRYTPHLLLEGIMLAAFAVGAHHCYLYIRGEYVREAKLLQAAIDEAYAKGFLGNGIFDSNFDLDVTIYRGAGAYICGEEMGLISSLEGKRGEPRVKPPFPATKGVFNAPTIVNNVETLCCIPFIVRQGGEWFASLGSLPGSGGTRLFGVSGHVKRPGLYEFRAGSITLRELIFEHCHGMLDDQRLKAVIPGGSSTPVLTAGEIDVVMDIDPLAKIGSMLGSGAVIVIGEEQCMVHLLWRITKFYAHESCGQCTPCREGCQWMLDILSRILTGRGRMQDLPLLLDITDNMNQKTICALGDAAAMPVASFVKKFRNEFEAYIRGEKCLSVL